AGVGGFSVAGAGASAQNSIAVIDKATVDGTRSGGIRAREVTLSAADTSSITATVGAAALSATIGLGGAGAAAASGAQNTTDNIAQASIATAGGTTTRNLTVTANEAATITAFAVAASFAGSIIAAVSSGGVFAGNTITTDTSAFVSASTLTVGGSIDIEAHDTSSASATTA